MRPLGLPQIKGPWRVIDSADLPRCALLRAILWALMNRVFMRGQRSFTASTQRDSQRAGTDTPAVVGWKTTMPELDGETADTCGQFCKGDEE